MKGSGRVVEPDEAVQVVVHGAVGRFADEPNVGTPLELPIYLGLFASAVTSATLLPGTSEILMLGLMAQDFGPVPLWLVATAGNVAGSAFNWWLGRSALRFRDRRWFPVGPEALGRAQGWYRRWGQPSLLLAWLPGVGDAFTVAAGVMRVPLATFLAMVTTAKGGRYAAVLGAGHGLGVEGWL
jgi:membrane protein YqaA with SNARE-associated domain